MKKLIPFFSLAVLAVACNGKPESAEVKTLQATQQNAAFDTAGLAQFQAWKAQNELAVANQIKQQTLQPEQPAPVKTVDVIREVRVMERQAPVRRTKSPRAQEQTIPVPPVESTSPETGGMGDVVANTGSGSAEGTGPAATGTEKAEEKKGWSKGAKGAAIGGGAGAVIGAVINKKNRAAGAVIGGVLGGAVGYGIGKAKDKKDTAN